MLMGLQIVLQCPQGPEHINMPIADAGTTQINETAEPPMVKYDVRQTEVTVDQGIRGQ